MGMTVDLAGYQVALTEQKERARAAGQFGAQDTDDVQVYLDLLRDLKAEGVLPPAGVAHLYDEDFERETVRGGAACATASGSGALGSATRSRSCCRRRRSTSSRAARWPTPASSPAMPERTTRSRSGRSAWTTCGGRCPGLIVHVGEVTLGTPAVGDPAWAEVDIERRMDIMRNHTATHLLHSELRYILGEHVHQAGSVVAPDRLRFDFTHSSMLTQDELDAVEQSVNDAILADYPVNVARSYL